MHMPRLHWMPSAQLDESACHSVLIAALRGLAALQVAAAHLRAEFFPGLRELAEPALWYQGLAFLTGFAHQAVVLFFLISGYLVGGSLLNKLGQPDALRLYAIDRISRLWTVLIPTFLLILALGLAAGTLSPQGIDVARSNPYSLSTFAGNLVGLQNVAVDEFGNNFPLWSLANEFWYYLMFPLLVLCVCGHGALRRAGAAAGLLLLCLTLPGDLVLYFSLWLLGAVFSRIRMRCCAGTRATLLAILLGLAVTFRMDGGTDELVAASFGPYLLYSVVFLLLLASCVVKLPEGALFQRLKKLATLLSNFSFTLYVVHVPLFGVLRHAGIGRLDPARLPHLALYLGMLAAVVLGAYGFYCLFEAHTYTVRKLLKNLLAQRGVAPAQAAPAKQ